MMIRWYRNVHNLQTVCFLCVLQQMKNRHQTQELIMAQSASCIWQLFDGGQGPRFTQRGFFSLSSWKMVQLYLTFLWGSEGWGFNSMLSQIHNLFFSVFVWRKKMDYLRNKHIKLDQSRTDHKVNVSHQITKCYSVVSLSTLHHR